MPESQPPALIRVEGPCGPIDVVNWGYDGTDPSIPGLRITPCELQSGVPTLIEARIDASTGIRQVAVQLWTADGFGSPVQGTWRELDEVEVSGEVITIGRNTGPTSATYQTEFTPPLGLASGDWVLDLFVQSLDGGVIRLKVRVPLAG